MGKKGRRRGRQSEGSSGGGSAASAKFSAPTAGYEDKVFTHGTARDAAVYEEVLKHLKRYLGTQPWREIDQLTKAIASLEAPAYVKPEKPKRLFYLGEGSNATTEEGRDESGKARVPVMVDAIFAEELTEY